MLAPLGTIKEVKALLSEHLDECEIVSASLNGNFDSACWRKLSFVRDNYQLFKVYKIAPFISGRKDESPRREIGLVLEWGHGTFTTIGTRQVFGYTSRTVLTCHSTCFLNWLWIVISRHSHDTSKYNFSNKVRTFSRSLRENRQLKHVHSITMEGESFSAYFCLHREIIREPFRFCKGRTRILGFPHFFPLTFCPVCLFV